MLTPYEADNTIAVITPFTTVNVAKLPVPVTATAFTLVPDAMAAIVDANLTSDKTPAATVAVCEPVTVVPALFFTVTTAEASTIAVVAGRLIPVRVPVVTTAVPECAATPAEFRTDTVAPFATIADVDGIPEAPATASAAAALSSTGVIFAVS
jgi:hypothetical protein